MSACICPRHLIFYIMQSIQSFRAFYRNYARIGGTHFNAKQQPGQNLIVAAFVDDNVASGPILDTPCF